MLINFYRNGLRKLLATSLSLEEAEIEYSLGPSLVWLIWFFYSGVGLCTAERIRKKKECTSRRDGLGRTDYASRRIQTAHPNVLYVFL